MDEVRSRKTAEEWENFPRQRIIKKNKEQSLTYTELVQSKKAVDRPNFEGDLIPLVLI